MTSLKNEDLPKKKRRFAKKIPKKTKTVGTHREAHISKWCQINSILPLLNKLHRV